MHQGWPKFASHLWMKTPDGGLAAVAYAPCRVETELDGAPVALEVDTDYPFGEDVRIRVHLDAPSAFPLLLRIPGWCSDAVVSIDDDARETAPATFHAIRREWRDGDEVRVRLPMQFAVERRYNDSAVIKRGPLVYSLLIGEDWRQIGGQAPHGDWEVHPTTPWNYGLQLGSDPAGSLSVESRTPGACPFSPEGAPVRLKAQGRRVPEWALERNAAAPPPASPVRSQEPLEGVTLIPYGCANLRVTEFPLLEESS
jgi:hypothetical protein